MLLLMDPKRSKPRCSATCARTFYRKNPERCLRTGTWYYLGEAYCHAHAPQLEGRRREQARKSRSKRVASELSAIKEKQARLRMRKVAPTERREIPAYSTASNLARYAADFVDKSVALLAGASAMLRVSGEARCRELDSALDLARECAGMARLARSRLERLARRKEG